MKVKDIPIRYVEIQENVRLNARDGSLAELMESIKQHGLKQAIGLGKISDTKYMLLYGSRRLKACKKLGWKTIPASIEPNPELIDMFTINMIENLHRKDVTPAELGRMCLRLKKLDLTDGEIATRLSIPAGRVKEAINIYSLIPEKIRKKVRFMAHGGIKKNGFLSASLATAALTINKIYALPAEQFSELLESMRRDELCISDVNIVASLMKNGMPLKQAIAERDKYSTFRINIVTFKNSLNELATKSGTTSNAYLKGVCYGQYPPIKEPPFTVAK